MDCREILEQELSGVLLEGFIEVTALVVSSLVPRFPASSFQEQLTADCQKDGYPVDLFSFKHRFPRRLWTSAAEYFKVWSGTTSA